VPVAGVAIPRGGYVPPCRTVPDFNVLRLSAGTGAGIGVENRDVNVIEGSDGAVMVAGNAWVVTFISIEDWGINER